MSWIRFDPCDYWQLPSAPAVYVIYKGSTPMYVGQTGNLFKRFNQYRMRPAWGVGTLTPWGQHEDITMKFSQSRKYGDWAMRELRLIRRLQPAWNALGSTAPRDHSGKTKGRKSRPKTTNNYVARAVGELGVGETAR